ncbi:uncharacterized protein [Triticum aestivum]|uniref:uncharacterized protein isoform X2 n=1 Tax=Triticum aestivum TaxID=4565 RepID=UPI001D01F0D0|nr:uncharacterized protein LOC123144358 isoform X2 [Triticum aestivum]
MRPSPASGGTAAGPDHHAVLWEVSRSRWRWRKSRPWPCGGSVDFHQRLLRVGADAYGVAGRMHRVLLAQVVVAAATLDGAHRSSGMRPRRSCSGINRISALYCNSFAFPIHYFRSSTITVRFN